MSEEASADAAEACEESCSEEKSGQSSAERTSESCSLEEKVDRESRERTDDGVIIIIADKDGTTLYETKPADYFDKSQVGTHQPIGGHIDSVDGLVETPLAAAKREVTEEISDKEAQEIIIKYLDGESQYKVMAGARGTTYVYAIVIEDDSEWKTVSSSSLGDDAGSKTLIPLEKLLKMEDKEFSWNYGPMIKEYVKETFTQKNTSISILPSYQPTTLYRSSHSDYQRIAA